MSTLLFQVLFTLFLAVMPFSEVRGAIPYGILVAKLNPILVFTASTLANLAIIYPLLITLNSVENFLLRRLEKLSRKKVFWRKVLAKYFRFREKTRRKVNPYVNRYGVIGLAVYTSIPLPFTGAWTATFAAYILGVKWKTTFLSVGLGVVLAATLIFSMVFLGVSIKLFF